MKKKILALLLTTAMVAASLVGCGNEQKTDDVKEVTETPDAEQDVAEVTDPDDGEPYEVHIIYRVAPQDEVATQAVTDYINNDILPDLLPNTTVSFEFIPASEYVEQIKLKSAAQEKMDLVLAMNAYGFTDFAAQGAYLAWNEYLDYMPNTKELIPESWWDAVTINGDIYGIPNYQITARSLAVGLDANMIEKYNVDIEKINTLEDVEELYLAPLKEGGEYANGAITGVAPAWSNKQAEFFELVGTDQISGMLVVENSDPTVVKNMFEVESVVDSFKLADHWVKSGYAELENNSGLDEKTIMSQNLQGTRIESYSPYWEISVKTNYDRDFVYKQITEPMVTTSSVRSTMTALGYTSENPYRAAKLLDLINSNEELFNAICYGIEGVNYTKNEDGTVTPIEDGGYSISTWSYQYGNTMNQYRLAGRQEDYNQKVDELNRSAKTSVTFGFSFDGSSVATETASCNAIIENYREGLMYGKYDDVQGTVDKMNEELYAAGLQTIIDEAQAQLDAWYAAQ